MKNRFVFFFILFLIINLTARTSEADSTTECTIPNNRAPMLNITQERSYKLNYAGIEILTEISGGSSTIAAVKESFLQSVIAAADQWIMAGTGTLVYYGTTTTTARLGLPTSLPESYAQNTALCDSVKNLIVVETEYVNDEAGIINTGQAQQEERCIHNGVARAFQITLFKEHYLNGQINTINWGFGNGGLDIQSVVTHELGHVFDLGHPTAPDFSNGTNAVMKDDGSFRRILREYDKKCAYHRNKRGAGYETYYRFVTSTVGLENSPIENPPLPVATTDPINPTTALYKLNSVWTFGILYLSRATNASKLLKNVFYDNDPSQYISGPSELNNITTTAAQIQI